MQKRKLWILIESMSQEERKRFPHWLKAELGDRQTYQQALCHLLTKAYPQPPQREDIWQILYPDTNFDDARLRKLTRDLTGWVEEFFAIEQFRSQKDEKNVALLRALYERDIPDEFEKAVRRFDREMEKRDLRDGAFFKLKYEIEREVIQYQVSYRQKLERPALYLKTVQESQRLQNYFDLWWISTKLEIASTNQAKKQITGQETDSILLSELLALIPKNALLAQEPFLRLYRKMTLLLMGDDSIQLESLLARIQEMKSLASDDLQTLWVALINHNIRYLNQTGDIKYAEQSLRLFEWAIATDFLLVEGYLPEVYYKNLIAFCLRTRNFEKARYYLEHYKKLLREERREDVYRLSQAIFYNTQKEYVKVIQTLNTVRMTKTADEVQARMLILQAFYEVNTEEIEWMLSQIKNLDRYIRSRHNMSEGNKKPFLNRLKLFKALLRADSKSDLEKIAVQIDHTNPLDTRKWLKEKVTDLLQRYN